MEFLLAGCAASAAAFITNPLEVVKVRFQLQGELKARGQHHTPYKHVFEAAKLIAQKEGLKALQKGVGPFCCYHFILNGFRLGVYQLATTHGIMQIPGSPNSRSIPRFLAVSTLAGVFGGLMSSPFFLVKTHLQSKCSDVVLKVGVQHEIHGMISGLRRILNEHGIFGLWRGATTQIPRIGVASCAQLFGYEKTRDWLRTNGISDDSWKQPLLASLIGGIFLTIAITPFDFISTRMYNQMTDAKGNGLYYRNYMDCVIKIGQKEGILAYFKGVFATYFRLGPFTLLNLFFWNRLNYYHRVLWKEK